MKSRPKWSTKLIPFYRIVNSVQSDEKTFSYGECSQGMLFLRFSAQIYLRYVFKVSAVGILACFES